MTQVLFDLKETSPQGDVPIDAQINCYPVARRKDGTVLVTRRGFTVRTGFKPTIVELHKTNLDGAWLITISSHNNDIVHGFYAVPAPNMVDGKEIPVPFNDLIMVDPDTLEPSEEPDPIWWAMARSTVTGGSVDGSGDLILTHYDGKTTNAGRVKGDRGERGLRGLPGEQGLQGDKGDKGDKGDTGAQGIQGAQGERGEQGEPGLDGADGVDGEDGAPGQSVTIVGRVPTAAELPATAAEGAGYITENDGHLHVFVGGAFIDVGQIKGDQGDQGAQGVPGAKGDKGDGVESAYRPFSDSPAVYPNGLTVATGDVAAGWPTNLLTVVTNKYSSARVLQFISRSDQTFFGYRVSTSGVWSEIRQIATDSLATTTANGLMSAADKVKLNGGYVSAKLFPNFQDAVDSARGLNLPLVVDTDISTLSLNNTIYSVPLEGKGSITVNGHKFWVNPQHQGIQTNTLYIDPTNGSDSNSGIDPAKPIKTFTRLNINLTMLREKLLDGFWNVVIKAGTHYLTSGWIQGGLRTKWPLIISGEGDKATILDGTNDTSGKAFLFKHHQTAATIKNLKIQNYIGGSDNDGYDTSAAIICQGPGQLRVEDVHVKDCTTGISVGYAISASVYRCTIEGSEARTTNSSVSTGVSVIYGASATVGGSGGNGNTISRCVTGVHVSRSSVAHVDFNTFEDNYYGLQASHSARAAVIDGNFNRNRVGIQLAGGSELTYSTAQYGVGANANTEYNMRIGGSARLTSYTGAVTSAVEYRLKSRQYPTPLTTPENMSRNVIEAFPSDARIPANTLLGAGKKIRVVLKGRAWSSTGLRRFQLSKNTLDGENHQIISTLTPGSGLTGAFTLEFVAETTSTPGQFIWSSSVVSAGYSLQNSGTLSDLDITHDWRFRIYQENLGSSDDTINISHTELFVTG